MEKLEKNIQNESSVTPESLEVGKNYIIRAPYSRGQYEGQTFDGEVEFLGTENDENGNTILYKFKYIKKPEHHDEVGGSSTYLCQEESLKYILEK